MHHRSDSLLSTVEIPSLEEQIAARLREAHQFDRKTSETCVGLYLMFLTLKRMFPHATFTPSLAVDLVWHAHMAMGSYEADCTRIAGRVLKHNPEPEHSAWVEGWERSKELFMGHFGVDLKAVPNAALGVPANCT